MNELSQDEDYLVVLRDAFALFAMQALIAKLPIGDVEVDLDLDVEGVERYDPLLLEVCRGAYDYADVMLIVRGEV